MSSGGSKEIKCFEDIEKFREACGASSVMLARAAMWNCSIFRKDGMLPLHDVIRDYLRLCVDFDNQATNVKYVIQNMIGELQSETSWGRTFLDALTLEEIWFVPSILPFLSTCTDFKRKNFFLLLFFFLWI